MKTKKLFMLMVLGLLTAFDVVAGIRPCWTYTDKDSKALCEREKRIEAPEKEIMREDRKNNLTIEKENGSSLTNNNKPALLPKKSIPLPKENSIPPLARIVSDQIVTPHNTALFDLIIKMPLVSFPDQNYARNVEFSTMVDCIELSYNFNPSIHAGFGYVKSQVPAVNLEDADFSYYNTQHLYGFIGWRTTIQNDQQIVLNLGLTDSTSNPEGTGKSITYDIGIYLDLKYLFRYKDFSFGPNITIIKAHSKNAKTMQENEKAGFTKVGLSVQIPLTFLGDVKPVDIN